MNDMFQQGKFSEVPSQVEREINRSLKVRGSLLQIFNGSIQLFWDIYQAFHSSETSSLAFGGVDGTQPT